MSGKRAPALPPFVKSSAAGGHLPAQRPALAPWPMLALPTSGASVLGHAPRVPAHELAAESEPAQEAAQEPALSPLQAQLRKPMRQRPAFAAVL